MRSLHIRLLLFYTALSLLFTWPLARHFTTHLPGNGIDDPALGWNLWWIKSRLIDQLNLDIFQVDWLFYPVQINLAFYTLTPLNGLLSVPLQTAFDLIVANNLVLLSSFVLSGYGVYLLVRSELVGMGYWVIKGPALQSPIPNPQSLIHAACFAGVIYAFAANKLFYAALGQFNIASSQWIPFCVLHLLRIGRSPTRRLALRNAALAGLFLVLQAWAELTYASFLLLFIALYLCWLLVARRPSPFIIHHLQFTLVPFLLLGVIFLLGLTPFLWAMLPDLRAEGDFFTSGGGFSDVFSADLAGYLVPTRLHWLLGEWVSRLPFPNDVGQQVYIGYVLGGLAFCTVVYALRTVRLPTYSAQFATRRRSLEMLLFWFGATFFFWWLTLGPHVRWLGQATQIPGPFALVSLLPFFNGNRYPSRYSVLVLLGVAVLAGIGLLEIRNWHSRLRANRQLQIFPLLWGIVVLGFTAEHLSIPLSLNDFRVPEIYGRLAAVPGDFTLLELPTGWRNGARVLGKSDKLIMMQQWYQTVHGKRRLGGNTSRNPPYKFQYFTQAPLLGDLIALMNADPAAQSSEAQALTQVVLPDLTAMIQRDRLIAPQVLELLGVQYVTVQVEKATPALLRFVDEALPLTLVDTWQGADWAGQPSTIRLYQVKPQSPVTDWTVDLTTPAANIHLGGGWSAITGPTVSARYATSANASLLLNLPATGGRLEFDLWGVQTPAFTLTINQHRVTAADWQELDQGCLNSPLSSLPPGSAASSQLTSLPCRLAVDIPAHWLIEGPDRLTFHFAAPATAVRDWVFAASAAQQEAKDLALPANHTLVVQSAGKDVGDFAHIYWAGQDVARHQRGYNLVALTRDAATGNSYVVRESTAFDTLSSSAQSAALVTWLQQWPAGTIIAGAVQDEASFNLGQDAVAALAQIGVVTDLRGKFRWSHAFIGIVGASPGTALEQAGLLQPATVYFGAPVDGAVVYGGVGQVRFTAAKP